MVIHRDRYLQKLIHRRENGMVKVINGIRRCRKSYLLFELYVHKKRPFHAIMNYFQPCHLAKSNIWQRRRLCAQVVSAAETGEKHIPVFTLKSERIFIHFPSLFPDLKMRARKLIYRGITESDRVYLIRAATERFGSVPGSQPRQPNQPSH